jgi:hypothetical protein
VDAAFQLGKIATETAIDHLPEGHPLLAEEGAVDQFHSLVIRNHRGPYLFPGQFDSGQLDRSGLTASKKTAEYMKFQIRLI